MYFTAVTSKPPITTATINVREKGKRDSFDNFLDNYFGEWVIADSTYTCFYFVKNTMCKNVRGMRLRVRQDSVTVLEAAKMIPFGQNRK